jgi:hypothetical protein
VRRCGFEWRWETFAACPVAAGGWSRGQPDPGDAGEGGKRPRQSRDVPVPPDGAGPASVMERSTRGTGVYVPQSRTGSNLGDLGRERCAPARDGDDLVDVDDVVGGRGTPGLVFNG